MSQTQRTRGPRDRHPRRPAWPAHPHRHPQFSSLGRPYSGRFCLLQRARPAAPAVTTLKIGPSSNRHFCARMKGTSAGPPERFMAKRNRQMLGRLAIALAIAAAALPLPAGAQFFGSNNNYYGQRPNRPPPAASRRSPARRIPIRRWMSRGWWTCCAGARDNAKNLIFTHYQ